MSDTPETDAYVAKLAHDWVLDFGAFDLLLTHARKLERERDEARLQAKLLRVENNHNWQANDLAEEAFRERDKARDTVFRLRKQRAIARSFGEQMERERDEAREAFAIATSNCVDAQQWLREMEDQRDFAMSEMERRGRERDKARDWVFRLRKQRAIARNFGNQMERDRDHWKRESLEQAKLLAMSADREERLRSQLQDAEIRALYEQRLKNTYKKMRKP
jgi:hypothetical protein